MRALYICYFGISEPLVNTQVIPYLRELTSYGHAIHLLTFEPLDSAVHDPTLCADWKKRMGDYGITWHWITYHQGGTITKLMDVISGAFRAVQIVYAHQLKLLHARSHMAMAMAMLAQLFTNTKTIFDIRGLQAEEYMDAGIWCEDSFAFRTMKWLERTGTRRANRIVVLTERMKKYVMERYSIPGEKIHVIPCCVDTGAYAETAKQTKPSERFTVIYAGSATGLYLLAEMAEFVTALRKYRPESFLHVLTASPVVAATDVILQAGLSSDGFCVERVNPQDVAKHAAQAQIGISFRKATISQIAASPTKIPEYLAAGVPVVSNAGIGDMDAVIEGSRVGVLIRDFTSQGLDEGAKEILELMKDQNLRDRCQTTAKDSFDLKSIGGNRYNTVYGQLEDQNGGNSFRQ